jgi:hypothetical protein
MGDIELLFVVSSCLWARRLKFGILVKELLFDDVYSFKVVHDKKSWFTPMELLDLIYHQLFFTANSLGCQPTTSHYFQPPASHTLALAAAAIYCALSE